MRIIETKVYTFNELSDEVKVKVIEKNLYLNVDHEWWENVYEDAENVGLKITGFDLGSRQDCTGEFIVYAKKVAEAILKDHGEDCETFKTALDYMQEYAKVIADQCQEEADFLCVPPQDEIDFETMKWNVSEVDTEDIDANFLRSLLEDYRIILQKEYEYLTSEEAIIECIEANEYEFTEKGEMI
jgi:hypothetical protein